MYIEASDETDGDKAILRALDFYKMEGSACTLEFYYHAWGANLGQLNVVVAGQVHEVPLTSQDAWRKHEIDLKDVGGLYRVSWLTPRVCTFSCYSDKNIIRSGELFKLSFSSM